MKISVIICCHNSRQDYLYKTVLSLKKQTLNKRQWELLIVDNSSTQKVDYKNLISWHFNSKICEEKKLGLSFARRKGIQLAIGDILIFVDDDNILAPNYLKKAIEISNKYPNIGAWGGEIKPKFEIDPPQWTKPYWNMLAIRKIARNKWSNLYNYETVPCGAGLCLRKKIANQYIQKKNIFKLDRKGKNNLSSFGDYDMAFTAIDLGYGMGQFKELKLIHLIASERLSKNYLLRLREDISFSEQIFLENRKMQLKTKITLMQKIKTALQLFKMSKFERMMTIASLKGKNKYFNKINKNKKV